MGKKNNNKSLKNRNKKLVKRKQRQNLKKKELNKKKEPNKENNLMNTPEFKKMMEQFNKSYQRFSYQSEEADSFKEEYGKISENIIDFAEMNFGRRGDLEANLKLAIDVWNYSVYRDVEIFEKEYKSLESLLLIRFDNNQEALDNMYYNKSSHYKHDIRLIVDYTYDKENEYFQVASNINPEISIKIEMMIIKAQLFFKNYSQMMANREVLTQSDLDNYVIIAKKNITDYNIVLGCANALYFAGGHKNVEKALKFFKFAIANVRNRITPYLGILESYLYQGAFVDVVAEYLSLERFIVKNNSKENLNTYKKFKQHYEKDVIPALEKAFDEKGDSYNSIKKYVKEYFIFEQAIFEYKFDTTSIKLAENLLPLVSNNSKEYLFLTILNIIVNNRERFDFYKEKAGETFTQFGITFEDNKDDLKDTLRDMVLNMEYM